MLHNTREAHDAQMTQMDADIQIGMKRAVAATYLIDFVCFCEVVAAYQLPGSIGSSWRYAKLATTACF
jgi:hypothetical protein